MVRQPDYTVFSNFQVQGVIGDPHPGLYPLVQVDFHVPAVSTLGSVSSWLDHSAPTQILSAHKGNGSSAIDLSVAMQYGTGLGINTLREQFAEINNLLHSPNSTTRNVILTLGNADAVTKLYRLLGEPGDTFLVEEYSFCGLTNAPIAQGVRWQPVKIDSMGLIPSDMETLLSTWDEAVRGRRPHVLYCIPCVTGLRILPLCILLTFLLDSTGQNPTGATLPLERRREIYAIAQKYDIVILEDGKTSGIQTNKSKTWTLTVASSRSLLFLPIQQKHPLHRQPTRKRCHA